MRRRQRRGAAYRRPLLEMLEDRVAPAVFTWDGGGANNLWSTPENWVNDIAPTNAEVHTLIFPNVALQKTNQNDIAGLTFSAITFQGSDYTISGTQISLTGTLATGATVTNNVVNLNINVQGADADQRFITVGGLGNTLTINGQLSSPAVVDLSKDGAGTLILSGNNSAYTGAIQISQGVVRITHANALGSATADTTVDINAQLEISNVAGAINEPLRLNGQGTDTFGGLRNVAGSNVWSGTVHLDSDSVIGVAGGTTLEITGVIDDGAAGHNLTKELTGTLILDAANTYRGQTIIVNGVLTIQHAQALGTGGTDASGTVVHHSSTIGTGTLRIDGNGLTIANERLFIHGPGFGGVGALHNTGGNNTWAGPVFLGVAGNTGNNASIGVAAGTTLTVSGVVQDSPTVSGTDLSKVLGGRLIFTNANTYTGDTFVAGGALNIRDSRGLGTFVGNDTTVQGGATLELEIDNIVDSVTGTNNLRISEQIDLNGAGLGGNGALRNISGQNVILSVVALQSSASIGVDAANLADANPLNDLSDLTVQAGISGPDPANLTKVGGGELIIPVASTYTGLTFINQGWVTIGHARALGDDRPNISETVQPGTTVANGAALHVRPASDNITVPEHITLTGMGITHSDPLLDQNGALLNLAGNNTFSGIIRLAGDAGIGVELGAGAASSQLTLNGSIFETVAGSDLVKLGNYRLIIHAEGSYTGDVDIREGVLRAQHDNALGAAVGTTFVRDGAALELGLTIANMNGGISGGLNVGPGERLVLAGAGNTTFGPTIDPLTVLAGDQMWRGPVSLETTVTIDLPANTRLSIFGAIDDAASPVPAGITKDGDGKLVLGGNNTYRGVTTVLAGILSVQHDNALGSPVGGTVVADNAQLEIQGGLTIAGESLTIMGNGPDTAINLAEQWFSVGPTGILNGTTPGRLETSGRITGIAVDPTDPNQIYVSTAGGGAWRTRNGGVTWEPLLDLYTGTANPVIFTGAIAIAPNNPNVIYLATGEGHYGVGNNAGLTYYGRGILRSTDYGRTWTLLTDPTAGTPNPLNRKAVTKIVVDPTNSNRIFIAVSDQAANGTPGGAGVWRFDSTASPGSRWFNLTNVVSAARAGGGISTPGPDDHFGVSFQSSNATYSDVTIVNNNGAHTLYMALGTPTGGVNSNGVFRTTTHNTNTPVWFVGSGVTNSNGGTNPFPTAANHNIKIAAFNALPVPTIAPATIYAAVTNNVGQLLSIQRSVDGGLTWAAVTSPGNYMGTIGLGNFASAMAIQNASTVVVAGDAGILRTLDGGTTWTALSPDAVGNGPHTEFHALAFDANGNILAGTDGGIFRYSTANRWTSINGDLEITQLLGITGHPNDLFFFYGATLDNGTIKTTGAEDWTLVRDGDTSQIIADPRNPNIVYHLARTLTLNTPVPAGTGNLVVERSLDGGTTWQTITTGLGSLTTPQFIHAMEIDRIDPSRLLLALAANLFQSANQGTNWSALNASFSVEQIAPAELQGQFVFDSRFPAVGDNGADNYDRNTIYVATSSGSIRVTKDNGTNWVLEPTSLPSISSLAVDPRNRDTVYATTGQFNGSTVIVRSTNAGQSFSNITFNLPAIPIWDVVVDGRNGDVYVGNDIGVYRLAEGATSWTRVGTGLPNVQVRELYINPLYNTLTAATFGRGAFQIWLDNAEVNGGGIRVLSGNTLWAGPVNLTGNLVINVENGAQINFLATIGDGGNGYGIDKVGGGRAIFSASNTYEGLTDVQEGVLAVRNPGALGSNVTGTVVQDGAALELESSIAGEPLTLHGDGFSFNSHNTGSLRNVSGNNTYSGNITFATDVTIGVNSGTSLDITGQIDDGGNGYSLTKELTGRLTLSNENTYGGMTFVEQGALRVQHDLALGTTDNGTQVRDGAQLQLHGGVTVVDEDLILSGTGIGNTGALLNTGGNNTWQGNISLESVPAFAPPSTPPTFVSIGVSSLADILAVDGEISEGSGTFGLVKVGPGKLALLQENTYTGLTEVKAGTLNIQHELALGTIAEGTIVRDGATLELESALGITVMDEELTLEGLGVNGGGALRSEAGDNTWDGDIFLQATSGVGASDGASLIIPTAIDGVTNAGLTKVGPGVVELDGDNLYTGITQIDEGLLQVDGTIGNVLLNGGILGGTGETGNVAATAQGGQVAPGNSAGTLTTGSETWTPDVLFYVELFKSTDGPGIGYDELVVNGNIDLGLAEIDGFVGPEVNIGDSFTIIRTVGGTVSGTFAGDTVVFIAGLKFSVDYSDNTKVVLTRQKNSVNMTLESDPNPSVYGAEVAIRALLEPEGGHPTILNGEVVVITIEGTLYDVVVDSNMAELLISTLAVGVHEITADFAGNTNFYSATAGPYYHTVITAPTEVVISSSANPSRFGEDVVITATVSALPPSLATPDGTVVFTVNGVDLPAETLVGGQASILLSGLSVGIHTISVAYSGSANFDPSSTPDDYLQEVIAAATATAVSTTPNPSNYGEDVLFTATVTVELPGSGTPTGEVLFFNGATYIGTGILNSSGQASITTVNTLTIGVHSNITAQYVGDGNFEGSTSAAHTHTVNRAATTAVLSSDNNPAVVGEDITFTLTISGALPELGPIGGTVTFTIGGIDQTPVPVVGNEATFTTNTLAIGIHNVTATYNGDANYAPASDGPLAQSVRGRSSTSLVAAPNPSVFGQTVNFTATVTSLDAGAGSPTGDVEFWVNGFLADTIPLTGNTAVYSTDALPAGNHDVFARYLGNTTIMGSDSSTEVQTVTAQPTTLSLSSTANPTVFGQTAFIVATVNPSGATPLPIGGSVVFTLNGIDQSPVSVVSGVAQFSVANLPVAVYTVSAVYSGDDNYVGSSASGHTHTVNQAQTTTTLATTNNLARYGEPVITAKVEANSPGSGVPQGQVKFTVVNGGTTDYVVDLVGDTATLPVVLPVGAYTISASYLGSLNYATSNGGPLSQTIIKADTGVTVNSPNPSYVGQMIDITATVAAVAPGAGVPTGTVTFLLNGVTPLATRPLVAGVATWSTNSFTVGTHNIVARYNSDTNFNGSDSDTYPQQVLPNPLLFAVVPTTVKSGAAFQVRVEFRDTSNNLITTFNGPVTLAVNSGPSGGSLGGAVTVNAVNGVAVFNSVNLNRAGDYTLRATFGDLPSVVSPSIRVTASRLLAELIVGSKGIELNKPFAIRVYAVDVTGAVDPNFNLPGTITVLSVPKGGKLTGNLAVNFVNGVANFTNLKINKAGSYLIRIAAGDLSVEHRLTNTGRRLT